MPLKIGLLLFYAAALLSLPLDFPPVVEQVLQYGSIVLLAAHALEAVLFLRWVKMYEGPLALSVFYTLLFGFGHWLPYKRRAEGGASS